MKTGIIYVATNTINNLQYVGQTTMGLRKRRQSKYNPYFQNAINKYGDKIEWQTVGEFSVKELDLVERCYIYALDTVYPNGYNFDKGGNKNKEVSALTRAKISAANKGRKHTKETKEKISKSLTGMFAGEKNPMFGKHLSNEHKQKISKSLIGVKCPSRANKYSEEDKCKISERSKRMYRENPELRYQCTEHFKGKAQSEEQREKIAIANGSKPFAVYKEKKLIGVWVNQSQCGRDLGLESTHISKCLRVNYDAVCKGYTFKYVDGVNK